MEKVLKIILLVAILSVTFISCGDVSQKVNEKFETLIKKTESLDSLLNKEVEKVLTLDSLIDKEHQKVMKLDSLIQKSSTRLDSVVNKIIKPENK
jgi:copper homeostasis protein CutC